MQEILNNPEIKQFLSHFKADSITPAKKPTYTETPPVWQDHFVMGETSQGDMRRWTQCRAWIKPPNTQFPTASAFLSFVNGKGSTFVRLNNIAELEGLVAALQSWLPIMKEQLETLKPLEQQYQAAQLAYDTILKNPNGDTPEED